MIKPDFYLRCGGQTVRFYRFSLSCSCAPERVKRRDLPICISDSEKITLCTIFMPAPAVIVPPAADIKIRKRGDVNMGSPRAMEALCSRMRRLTTVKRVAVLSFLKNSYRGHLQTPFPTAIAEFWLRLRPSSSAYFSQVRLRRPSLPRSKFGNFVTKKSLEMTS